MKRWLRIAALALMAGLLAYCGYGMLRPTTHTYTAGRLGVPVVVLANNGPSRAALQALIDNEGGLPKRSQELTYVRGPGNTHTLSLLLRVAGYTVPVTPVERFEIVRATVKGGDILALGRRGELAFTADMEFRVQYTDGDTAVLRWSTWGYGWALGPLAGARSGPAGGLSVLERSWRD